MTDEAPSKPSGQTIRPLLPSWLILILFAVVGFMAYFNSLSAPFLFDDIVHIKNNPSVRTTFEHIGWSARAWNASFSQSAFAPHSPR